MRKDPDESAALSIIQRISSDLLNRLAPKFRLATVPSQTEKVDALARMIRDVDNGEASAGYDISSPSDVLKRLGLLSWRRNPVWEWARQYNYVRASETSNDEFQLKPVSRTTSTAHTSAASRKSTPATIRAKKAFLPTRSPPGLATEPVESRPRKDP